MWVYPVGLARPGGLMNLGPCCACAIEEQRLTLKNATHICIVVVILWHSLSKCSTTEDTEDPCNRHDSLSVLCGESVYAAEPLSGPRRSRTSLGADRSSNRSRSRRALPRTTHPPQ